MRERFMKRFSLVLLFFLMCFLMFSCDDYTHTPSVSSENTSSETVSDTSSQEVTSSESISSAEENQRNENTNLLNRDYGQSQPETQELITINGERYQSYVDEDTTLRYVFMTKNEYSELSMFWHWKKDKLWDWIPIGTEDVYSLSLVGVIYEGDDGKASLPNT